ncbi:hypothetical protein V6R21_07005 [Limibacter armeniacum]|uniref:hypothetical protein n=1 Tax=Limibacter armeniacum TaxID=466084 RepID=UPI002FE5BC88
MTRDRKDRGNNVYKFVVTEDVWIQTSLKDISFENDWISFENGIIRLKGTNKQGYAWDGCSPKKIWLDLVWGTPDGRLDERTELPLTYYASLFHDAIYQFKDEIVISRKEADLLFRQMMKETGFVWSGMYYFFVRMFGGFYGKWLKKESAPKVEVKTYSWLEVVAV